MNKQDIKVKTLGSDVWLGYILVEEDKRTQDMLNDPRVFLPFFRLNKLKLETYELVFIHKDFIAYIEEQ